MINVWMLRVRIRSRYFYLNFIHFQDFEFLILYKHTHILYVTELKIGNQTNLLEETIFHSK